ncbi:2-dehydro-3-deoxyphosphogluconate aldolase [Boudabousia tangfeifanii]|uniref:2-dehydro-3-deoxy-phosphogluconate aldolase n=1 Tax=Boudabousia tangfeifanii TaxID=1912795 RepID=A0A1D9MK59_9ACTO|nr:bifunctional 4-hydroxy-2-oxoglutarate aldolase/2-dehydro-3-deoxy-phosphogluconate aldolase [Boudabousia tangfeifanii]AOZ72569.1 2-dehydro-3-deoxyphosphogluconate aldolase [Boudabousia tangfeifanii]
MTENKLQVPDIAPLLPENPLVPVVVIDDAKDAVPTAQALAAGGITCAEVTFRTAAAPEAIRLIAEAGGTTVGAGTIINAEQANAAIDAGAKFLVSPGLSREVAEVAAERGVPLLPGVATPSEIVTALSWGLTTLKFFPAEAMGGLPVLKAFAGPFGQVKFVPTGGIGLKNLAPWAQAPFISSIGGSWMVTKAMINAGDFEGITKASQEALAAYQAAREELNK